MNPSYRNLALAASALLAASGGAVAGEDAKTGPAAKAEVSPAEQYTARKSQVLLLIAAKLESPANFAFGNDLKQTAVGVYNEILEFDADNKKARDQLGFEKKDGAWVANESKQAKIKEYEDLSKGEKKRGEFDKKRNEANKECAKLLAEVGNLAKAAGDDDAARSHWKQALEFDDQNPVANEKMGNRLVDKRWFTGRALAHKEWEKVYKTTLSKAQNLPFAPVLCEETTGIAEAAGLKVEKYKTKNFRIESNLSAAEIRDTLVWLERARQFFIDLFDVPPHLVDYSADPDVFVLVRTKEQHEKLIDACAAIPPELKSFNKKFTANAITNKLSLRTAPEGESAQRDCIHTATHSFCADSFGRHSPWLYEALANSVSASIKRADLHVCFSGQGTTGGIHMENISLEQAPPLLRDLIKEKKDTPIGEFVKLPSDAMSAQMIAKSWSIVMFLMEMDRGQARSYFEASGQGGDGEKSKDDKVLKQYFPDYATWYALDEAWREWALDVYKP